MVKTVTLGIDISSQPEGTAACAITWEPGRAVATTPGLACDDEKLTELIADADAVDIDAPFGWPADFTAAVAAWTVTLPLNPPAGDIRACHSPKPADLSVP